jgi:hypothetical protein
MNEMASVSCGWNGCGATAEGHVTYNFSHSKPVLIEAERIVETLYTLYHANLCRTHIVSLKDHYPDMREYELGTCGSKNCPLQ